MVKEYKIRPEKVQAIQYNGENLEEIYDFIGSRLISLKGIKILKTGDFVIKMSDGSFFGISEDVFKLRYVEL